MSDTSANGLLKAKFIHNLECVLGPLCSCARCSQRASAAGCALGQFSLEASSHLVANLLT
eukprot:46058-Amphidinium_carterae.2